MGSRITRLAMRAAYGASQLSRVAWFVGHALTMSRLAQNARQEGESTRPAFGTTAPMPNRDRLYADMAALFRQDLANMEAGLYPLPADHDGPLLTRLNR